METERAYLVQIGTRWINLAQIVMLAPSQYPEMPDSNKVEFMSGLSIYVSAQQYQVLMETLTSFGMLAS
jgi:hypothetical protein